MKEDKPSKQTSQKEEVMKTRSMKKALTFVLAFAMIASMFSFGALAATSDPNFTASQFTYTIGISSSSVDVYVGPADSDYQLSGYDNLTDANNAVITPDITIGDDIASIGSGTGVLHGGLYLKKYTVTRDDPSALGSLPPTAVMSM